MAERTRRDVLATTALVAIGAVPALAEISSPIGLLPSVPQPAGKTDPDAALLELDRIAEPCHRFERLDDLDDDDPAFDECADAWDEAVRQISTMPAHTLAGIAVKVKWTLRDQFQGESNHAWAMAQGLLQDLSRLTGLPVPKVDTAAERAEHG